jgi:hypothetical protein
MDVTFPEYQETSDLVPPSPGEASRYEVQPTKEPSPKLDGT